MSFWNLFGLACERCETDYPPAGLPAMCPQCGGFWRFSGLPAPTADLAQPGLRRWARALGLIPEELPAHDFARPVEQFQGVWLSQQGRAVSGGAASGNGVASYKERGAEVLAAVCRRRGVKEVFLDSSGNAGLAVASACARRSIRCTVLLPATTPEVKQAAITAAGGVLEIVDGDRAATAAAAHQRRKDPRFAAHAYASHVYQPFFLLGVATLTWDVHQEFTNGKRAHPLPLDWTLPVGNGALLLGVELGLCALEPRALKLGTRLHAVQLAGYASLHPEGASGTDQPSGTVPTAAGIAIANPPRRVAMLRAIQASGGSVTQVTEEEIADARTALAGAGFAADATGAAAWAGLHAAREVREPRGSLVIVSSRTA